MVDMTLNNLYAKVKVIPFGTNRFLTYNFRLVNSNFCSRTHYLAKKPAVLRLYLVKLRGKTETINVK